MTRRLWKAPEGEHLFVRILPRLGRVLEWVSLLLGLMVIGTCTLAGLDQGGYVLGLFGCVSGLVVAFVLVALVFLAARVHLVSSMKADLEAIRSSLEARGEVPSPPDEESAGKPVS